MISIEELQVGTTIEGFVVEAIEEKSGLHSSVTFRQVRPEVVHKIADITGKLLTLTINGYETVGYHMVKDTKGIYILDYKQRPKN